ncbi:MAG: hypothetical protein IPG64_16475 [Haliea sp.]|nr:hypothetical protein [Haliea sp.]
MDSSVERVYRAAQESPANGFKDFLDDHDAADFIAVAAGGQPPPPAPDSRSSRT